MYMYIYIYSLYHVAKTLRRRCEDLDSARQCPRNRLRNCIIASVSLISLLPLIATRRCGGRSRLLLEETLQKNSYKDTLHINKYIYIYIL